MKLQKFETFETHHPGGIVHYRRVDYYTAYWASEPPEKIVYVFMGGGVELWIVDWHNKSTEAGTFQASYVEEDLKAFYKKEIHPDTEAKVILYTRAT